MTDASITKLADEIMRRVVATGVVNKGNIDTAITVMRAEMMAFLTGDEWRNERECIIARSVSEATVLSSLIASIVLKIKAAA